MVEQELLDAFNNCIDRLASGQSLEDCLRAYPQYAAQLAPMLEAGLLARRARYSRDEVLQAQERVRFRIDQALRTTVRPARRTGLLRHVAALAASAVLLFGLAGTGGAFVAALVAQESLPGDPLYGVKLLTEDLRLVLAGDESALRETFARRRIEEVRRLLALGREADVTFEGRIDVAGEDITLVEGLPVVVGAATPGMDALLPGSRVEVRARTTAGGDLVALTIRLIPPEESAPSDAIPSETPTGTPGATAVPTLGPGRTMPPETPTAVEMRTAAPFATNTGQPRPSPSPGRTADPTPTMTVSPARTPTREPACVVTPPQDWARYTVQPGDTLSRLAERAGVTVERIQQVNCIEDPRLLIAGQTILLPAQRDPAAPSATPGCVVAAPQGWIPYTTQQGDTLTGLAERAGVSLEIVAQVNCIRPADGLTAGQILYVPRPRENNAPPTPTQNSNTGGRRGNG